MLAFNVVSAADANDHVLNNVSDTNVNVESIDHQNVQSIEDCAIDDNTNDFNNDIEVPDNQSVIDNDIEVPDNQSVIDNDIEVPDNQTTTDNDSNIIILANNYFIPEQILNVTIGECTVVAAGSGGSMNSGAGAAMSETGEDAIRLLEDLGVINKISYWTVKAFVKVYQLFDGRMTDDMAEWLVDYLAFHEHDLREELIFPTEKIVAKLTSVFIHDISSKISSIFHWIF